MTVPCFAYVVVIDNYYSCSSKFFKQMTLTLEVLLSGAEIRRLTVDNIKQNLLHMSYLSTCALVINLDLHTHKFTYPMLTSWYWNPSVRKSDTTMFLSIFYCRNPFARWQQKQQNSFSSCFKDGSNITQPSKNVSALLCNHLVSIIF